MKKYLLPSLLFISAIVFGQTEKVYDFKDFTSIKIESTFSAEIVQSEQFMVKVICPENMISSLEVEKEGDELEVGLHNWKGNINGDGPKVIINIPNLKELEVSGASSAKLVKIESADLKIEVSGASSIEGDMLLKKIEIDASGASSIGLSGMTNKMSLYLSGASSFRGKGFLVTDELLLDCSGASNVHAQVDGDMFIKLSGASNFTYHGEGDILKEELSGASIVTKE